MPEDEPSVYEFGPFRLDAVERQLSRDGTPVSLTDKVFELLLLLVRHRGHALAKAELMDRLWPDTVVEENNLTVNISLLRKALGEGRSERRYIETLSRRGYRFVAAVRSGTPPASGASGTAATRTTTGPPALVPSSVPFVGREQELSRLEGMFERARAGRGRVVFVTGAPGMGKTELCEQLLRKAAGGEPSFSATGHCFEHYGAVEAYLPFLQLIGQLLAGPAADVVLPLLHQYAPTWAAQFPKAALARASGESENTTRATNASSMVRELGDALEALSRLRPLLLVLEDLHWADPSSLDALRLVGERCGNFRALFVATFRAEQVAIESHPLKNLERELLAHGRCEEIALSLLEPNSITRYLDARFAAHDLPLELAALIAQRSEGQPLFVTRLVQLLVDRGDVRELDGRWRLVPAVSELALGVPDSVRGLIERKFESLDESEQLALRYASAIGAEFGSTLLSAVLAVDEVSLEEQLDRLARTHRLLERLGEERLPQGRLAVRYRFAHVLYRDVLYESLASKRRQDLHGRVAAALLEQYGAGAPRVTTQLAVHFEAARDLARAIEHWIAAGDDASRLHATREATQHFAHALELVNELEPNERLAPTIILRYNLGWCHSKVGSHGLGLRDFELMLKAARAQEFTGADAAAERARSRVFDYLEQPWRDAFGLHEQPRMQNQPRALGPSAIQGEAYWGICYTLLEAGDLDALSSHLADLLRLAESTRNGPRRVEALAWAAAREIKLSNLEAARAFADDSIQRGREIGHTRALFVALHAKARAHYRLAEYETAAGLFAECLPLAIEAQGRIECLLDLGRARAQLGLVGEALSSLDEARAIADHTDHPAWSRVLSNVSGGLLLELGDFEGALGHYQRGLGIARERGLVSGELSSWMLLCRAHAEAGAIVPANEALAAALSREPNAHDEFARPGNATNIPVDGLGLEAARAVYELERGATALASDRARRLLALATAVGSVRHRALAHHLLARAALRAGALVDGEREARAGLELLAQRTLPFVRLRLLSDLGSLRLRSRQLPEARECFEHALSLVDGVGEKIGDPSLSALWLASPRVRELRAGLAEAEKALAEPQPASAGSLRPATHPKV
jgi:DNA-binding winged helix-turn-helix (wHTH) protein/tetratricopeptide (TPR) repeat protein